MSVCVCVFVPVFLGPFRFWRILLLLYVSSEAASASSERSVKGKKSDYKYWFTIRTFIEYLPLGMIYYIFIDPYTNALTFSVPMRYDVVFVCHRCLAPGLFSTILRVVPKVYVAQVQKRLGLSVAWGCKFVIHIINSELIIPSSKKLFRYIL